jgi:hypothetical protein
MESCHKMLHTIGGCGYAHCSRDRGYKNFSAIGFVSRVVGSEHEQSEKGGKLGVGYIANRRSTWWKVRGSRGEDRMEEKELILRYIKELSGCIE